VFVARGEHGIKKIIVFMPYAKLCPHPIVLYLGRKNFQFNLFGKTTE
jgi:hypothetical protein